MNAADHTADQAAVIDAVHAARDHHRAAAAGRIVTILHNLTDEQNFLIRQRPSGPEPGDLLVPTAEFTVGLGADLDMVTDPDWGDTLQRRRAADVESVSGAYLARVAWTLTNAPWHALYGGERDLARRLTQIHDRSLREGDAVLVGPPDEPPTAYGYGQDGAVLLDLAELGLVDMCGRYSRSLLCPHRPDPCRGNHQR